MEVSTLNIFQRCIRVWEESHPYNAAQVLHVKGPADAAKIAEAWNESLAACGLGMVRVKGRHFGYESAPSQHVVVVEGELGLERFVSRELNRAFDEPAKIGRRGESAVMPFRPFVVPGDGSHYLGVVYQHWIADSVSIRMLLREWFCRMHDPEGALRQRLHIPQEGLWHYFGPQKAQWNLAAGALSAWRSLKQLKRSRKLEHTGDDHRVVCTLHRLPDGLVDGLVGAARKHNATVNDLLVAALARACDGYGPAPRRSELDLALGTIVDLRQFSPEDLKNTFGLFFGFMEHVVKAEDLKDRERLLSRVAASSAQQKARRSAAASILRMAAGFAQGRLLSQDRLASFYRNYMPLFGGVSNVNMNRSWPAKYFPACLLDYIRVAPTGPMVPLVIAATTIGNRFTFMLTRRAAVVDEAGGAGLAQAFVDELTALHDMG